MPYEVIRSHEICAGHRVVGHESKCRHLHGHNYKFHFHVEPKVMPREHRVAAIMSSGVSREKAERIASEKLDTVGRVIDFSVVKSTLCEWLEDNWDHKFLHWDQDPLINALTLVSEEYIADHPDDIGRAAYKADMKDLASSLVSLPFNPTAENLAAYMVEVIGPSLLDEHGVELVKCTIEETSKCHVGYTK